MSTAQIEGQLLRKFEKALRQAIERHETLSWEDVDGIARQKLLLQAIHHFDLEHLVTIQWFKDGDVLTELDNYDTEVGITNAGVNEGPIPSEEDIISYFLEEGEDLGLENVLNVDDRMEWLEDYYESREQVPFRKIYLIGMRIHLHIRNLTKGCSENAEPEEFPDDIVAPIDNATRELKRELNRYPLFRNIPPYVTEFNRIASTILREFQKGLATDEREITKYANLFSQLNKFYYETVWNIISNRIGFYTAEGPNEESVRTYREGSLKVSKSTFIVELDKLREECHRNDIHVNPQLNRLPDLEGEYGDLESILEWDISDSLDHNATSD